MSDIPLTITDAARGLRSGEFSSAELTDAVLDRADRYDPLIGSYISRMDDAAREAARRADEDFARGVDRGVLQGIPTGVKDLLAVAGAPTTANAVVLDPAWGAGRQGPVVDRLVRGGAVITGKTATYEFAMSPPMDAGTFPISVNPWDLDRSPGGSSSGTASGVAAGFFLAGIGSDTAGSIRGPAAWCGITGLKPTFGRVPKSGCVPLAYSLDHVGPMARSARDCAAMLSVIAGHHASDESSSRRPVDDYLAPARRDLAGLRIGVVREHHFPERSDPAAEQVFDAAVAQLVELGATVVEVGLPRYVEAVSSVWVMIAAEALAYHRQDLQTRWNDYLPATRMNIATGALISGADYVQAGRVRRVAQAELGELFRSIDLIASPLASIPGMPMAEMMRPGVERGLGGSVFTPYWNAVGNPALALPMGFTAEGLPLSLQLAARPFEEQLLLGVADAYQQVTDWHLRTPEFRRGLVQDPPLVDEVRDLESLETVRALLAVSGLRPTDDDLEILSDAYPARRRMVESFYALAETKYVSTSLVFDPSPEFVDWHVEGEDSES